MFALILLLIHEVEQSVRSFGAQLEIVESKITALEASLAPVSNAVDRTASLLNELEARANVISHGKWNNVYFEL